MRKGNVGWVADGIYVLVGRLVYVGGVGEGKGKGVVDEWGVWREGDG